MYKFIHTDAACFGKTVAAKSAARIWPRVFEFKIRLGKTFQKTVKKKNYSHHSTAILAVWIFEKSFYWDVKISNIPRARDWRTHAKREY